MNQLSWLLYWADVLPSFATSIGATFLILCAFSCIMTLFFVTAGFGTWEYDGEFTRRFRFFPIIAAVSGVLFSLSNLVPTKQTFYLIAASEMGGQVLNTPEFSKVRRVVNEYLDDALKPEPKKEKSE